MSVALEELESPVVGTLRFARKRSPIASGTGDDSTAVLNCSGSAPNTH
jgi:hypothetical protein